MPLLLSFCILDTLSLSNCLWLLDQSGDRAHKKRGAYEMLRGCPVLTAVMCYLTVSKVPLGRKDTLTFVQNTHSTSLALSNQTAPEYTQPLSLAIYT